MVEAQLQLKNEVDTHFDLRGSKLSLEELSVTETRLFQARFLLEVSHPEFGQYTKAAASDIEVHEVPIPYKNYSRIRYTTLEDLRTRHILHVGLDGLIRCNAKKTDSNSGARTTILEGWLTPLTTTADYYDLDKLRIADPRINAS